MRATSQWIKWTGLEVDHSFASHAKFKCLCIHTSIPPSNRAPTLLYSSYLQNNTCLWIEYKKDLYFIWPTTYHFPLCLWVPRWSRQHKRRQAADSVVCEIARLLKISLNKATLPSDWKKPIVVPIYKRNDRSAFTNYRPISLTTVVGKQLEQL